MFAKLMKDSVTAVAATPELIRQSSQLQAQAQEFMATRQAAAEQAIAAQMGGVGHDQIADLTPIDGVSLETYAAIARQAADRGVGAEGVGSIAALHGVSLPQWERAAEGWIARMQTNPAVGSAFHRAYMGA